MSKEGIAKLQAYIDTGDYLLHGSPRPGLEVLRPGKDSKLIVLGADRQRIELPPAVHATDIPMVAVFIGAIWSKNGLSGYHTYRHARHGVCGQYNAAPQVIRNARHRQARAYVMERQRMRARPETPGSYMSLDDVPIVDVVPVELADFTPTLLVAAEVPLISPALEPLPDFADLPPEEQRYYSYKWVFAEPDTAVMNIPGYDYRQMMRTVRVSVGEGPYSAHYSY